MVDTPTSTPYHSKALPAGSTLREWKLESVLGVGGFGIVYRGRGIYFDEVVAIKEYFPTAISDRIEGETVTPTDSSAEEVYAHGLKKFVEEAKILWNLSKPERHPNIVSVKSLFEIHGTAYMVMDFETGASLSQMLRDGKHFDEKSLLALVRPIAEGLDRVHRAGVIHRDIKPANILIDDNGRPVLIDFGSARFDAGQATSTQVTFYTPPYAAIEQYVKTYPQGPWTDIYALGVALYQCVTGEKPPDALERMHGSAGERLSSRERPGFSQTFTRAVDAAMRLRPSERPQSMPDWMAMFEPGYVEPEVVEEDATRVSVSASPTASGRRQRAAHADAAAAAEAASEPAAAAVETADEPARRRAPVWPWLAATGVVVALGAGGAGFLYWQTHHKTATIGATAATTTATAGKAAPAPVAATAPALSAPSVQPIQDAAAGLLADAQHAGRPRGELAALAAANGKITALAAQLKGGPASAGPPLADQLNSVAIAMARSEVAALNRTAQVQAREVAATLGESTTGGSAVAAVQQAKAALAAAGSGAIGATDPLAAIAAARRALPAYAAFAAAYARATPLYVAARRTAVTAELSAARGLASQIVSFANGPRPGLFATQGRRQAYQDLQADAEKAKGYEGQLDRIAQSATAASDVAGVNASLAQAAALKASLGSLYASASALVAANK
jgi:non-specific serine/threonine protein kinase